MPDDCPRDKECPSDPGSDLLFWGCVVLTVIAAMLHTASLYFRLYPLW